MVLPVTRSGTEAARLPTVSSAPQTAFPNSWHNFTITFINIVTIRFFNCSKASSNIIFEKSFSSGIHANGLSNLGITKSSIDRQNGRSILLIKSIIVGSNWGGPGQSEAAKIFVIKAAPGNLFKKSTRLNKSSLYVSIMARI